MDPPTKRTTRMEGVAVADLQGYAESMRESREAKTLTTRRG